MPRSKCRFGRAVSLLSATVTVAVAMPALAVPVEPTVLTHLQLPDRVRNEGTLLEFNRSRGGADPSSVRLPFPLLGPDDLQSALIANDGKVTFVFDPDDPQWYTIVDKRKDHFTITINGDAYLLFTNSGTCELKTKTFQDFSGRAELTGDSLHTDGTSNWLEYTFRQDCVPYTIQVRCESGCGTDGKDGKSVISDYKLSALDKLKVVLRYAAKSDNIAATNLPQHASYQQSLFRYVEPGLLLDYRVPVTTEGLGVKEADGGIKFTCKSKGPPTQTWLSNESPFARMVDTKVEVFPISLPLDQDSFANSQVLTVGGTYSPFREDPGSTSKGTRINCVNLEQISRQANPGNKQPLLYHMPWRDTFCEYRGHGAKRLPYCGKPFQGGHEGLDLRPPRDVEEYYVVSATNGVVDGVNPANGQISVRYKDSRYYYLHMKIDPTYTRAAKIGQVVYAGMPLGLVSKRMEGTDSTTRHLHWEIMRPVPFDDFIGKKCQRGRRCRTWENFPPYATAVYAFAKSKGLALPLTCDRTEPGAPTSTLCRLQQSEHEIYDWDELRQQKLENDAKMLDPEN